MEEFNITWEPLNMGDSGALRIHTFTLDDALEAMREDYRCDSEAALALWLFARSIPDRKIN